MDDLDWLARNTPETPVHGMKYGEWYYYNGSFIKGGSGYFELPEVATRRAELQNKPSWDDADKWNGEGLPPVGAVCEAYTGNPDIGEGYIKAEVIGHKDAASAKVGIMWPIDHPRPKVFQVIAKYCRPIQSEEDRAVEEALIAIDAEDGDHASVSGVVRRMIAAGYCKKGGE